MYRIKNENMLRGVEDEFPQDIIHAMKNTNRELFMPQALAHLAYTLNAIPMSDSQFVSSPHTVLEMTKYLMAHDLKDSRIIKKPDSVLEIGLGSGYQAVILSKLIRRVFSIERIRSLYDNARNVISKLGITNINTKLDDGSHGWDNYAPYDRILFSACCDFVNEDIFRQLKKGGILVAPVRQMDGNVESQVVKRYIKIGNHNITEETLGNCEFVPIKKGIDQGR